MTRFMGCINCIGFHAYPESSGHCGCYCHEEFTRKEKEKDNIMNGTDNI